MYMSPFLAAALNNIVSDATDDGTVVILPSGNLKGWAFTTTKLGKEPLND